MVKPILLLLTLIIVGGCANECESIKDMRYKLVQMEIQVNNISRFEGENALKIQMLADGVGYEYKEKQLERGFYKKDSK